MAIAFECSGCGKSYSVGDDLAGKKARCKKCGHVMSVPASAKADADDAFIGFRDDEPVTPAPASVREPTTSRAAPTVHKSAPTATTPPALPPMTMAMTPPTLPAEPGARRATTIRDARPTAYTEKASRGTIAYDSEGFSSGWFRTGIWLLIMGVGGNVLPFFGYQFKVLNPLGYGSLFAAFALGLIGSFAMFMARIPALGGIGLFLCIVTFGAAFMSFEPEDETVAQSDPVADIMAETKRRNEEVRQQMLNRPDPMRDHFEQMRRDNEARAAERAAETNARVQQMQAENRQRLAEAVARITQGQRERLATLTARVDAGGPREDFQDDIDTLRGQVASAIDSYPGAGEIEAIRDELQRLTDRVGALPSREPHASVFVDAEPIEPWEPVVSSESLDSPVTVLGAFDIRPPAGTRIDLTSRLADAGRWSTSDGAVVMTVRHLRREAVLQKRPWIIVPAMVNLANDKQLVYAFSSNGRVQSGTLGGLLFTRAECASTQKHPVHRVRYIALDGDRWLVADIEASQANPSAVMNFEAAIRTLKRHPQGESPLTPFTPQMLVSRLGDSPDAASKMLIEHGAAAEKPLLEWLKTPDCPGRAAAVAALSQVASAESVPLLWELSDATDADSYAPARRALARLVPADAEPVKLALADLAKPIGDAMLTKQRDAMLVLADAKADDRATTIAPVLEKILVDASPADLVDAAGRALAVWHRKETVEALLPVINDPASEQKPSLDPALRALGRTKDPRVLRPILSWSAKRPEAVAESCRSIGQPAEVELIKMLSLNPQACDAACGVLKHVGTKRSLVMLDRVARDRGASPELQAKARAAVDAIRARG